MLRKCGDFNRIKMIGFRRAEFKNSKEISIKSEKMTGF